MMESLFGWNTFNPVKTINIYNNISIHCLPRRLCVFHLFKQPKCSLTHVWNLSHFRQMCLLSKKSRFFSLAPYDFLQISPFSNNAASVITCLIVIDGSDFVKLSIHSQASCSRSQTFIMWGKIRKTARTAAPVVYQSRQRWNQTVSTGASSQIQMLLMLFIYSKPCKHPPRFVKNVCSVVQVFSFIRTMGLPTVWCNVNSSPNMAQIMDGLFLE